MYLMPPMGSQGLRLPVPRWLAVILYVGACSSHDRSRTLSPHLPMAQCAVDESSVYVYEPDAISRVDRKTGQSTFLTNDTHFVFDMVPINGDLYWIGGDGVYEWQRDATTRLTIATFADVGGAGHRLARVAGELCWADESAESGGVTAERVDCLDLQHGTVSTRFRASVPLDVASYHDHIYVATYPGKTIVFDITDPATPRQLAELPKGTGDLTATHEGPVLVQFARPGSETIGVWIASDPPRKIPLADEAVLQTAGDRSYVVRDDHPPQRIDLVTGALTPVPHARGQTLCGDDDKLYVEGEHEALIELPNR